MRCTTGTVLTSVKPLLGSLPVALGLPEFPAIIGRRKAEEKEYMLHLLSRAKSIGSD